MVLCRRKFISQAACITAGWVAFSHMPLRNENRIMTVNGWIGGDNLGFTLTHEHIMVDFIGADKINPSRYNADEVFTRALVKLVSVKEKGCMTLIECTPAYLGRNVYLLKQLSDASGLTILTNTGYYGASGEKFLPAHTWTETAEQLAKRWITEWTDGIDGSGIRPGFIKSGVDNFPLSAVQQKIVEAAAITHRSTGLAIAIHTGNGLAALEEMRIIESEGVAPEAWIWIHAQNETNRDIHVRAAEAGGWVSFDNVSVDSMASCLIFLSDMKKAGLLGRVLISHDSGWYHVGEPGGGIFHDYNTIFDKLVPAMTKKGFTQNDIRQLFFINPVNAFAVAVRKKK